MLRMLDLFSGIGGFSYAGEKLVGGYKTVAFCEYDKHAQKVLRKHWPNTEIIDDVRELANDADRFRGVVDIICGGYPCQPFSQAGKRLGDQDDRHLWPAMFAVIKKVRPTWVIGENVAGHITMGLDEVLSDLETEGYSARTFVIPAVAADAPHRRDRCWIVAHTDCHGKSDDAARTKKGQRVVANARHKEVYQRGKSENVGSSHNGSGRMERNGKQSRSQTEGKNLANTDSAHPQGRRFSSGIQPQHTKPDGRGNQSEWQAPHFWQPEPSVGRVANGVSGRIHRLKQLGNSIVPQVAARILWAIKEAHNG